MSGEKGETKLRVLEKKTPESCGVVERELTPLDMTLITDSAKGHDEHCGGPKSWDCTLGGG